MDADDIALIDRLALQVEFMEEHPEIAVVGGAVEFIDQSGKVLRLARQPLHNDEIQRSLVDQSVIWHPTVMMRRDAFDRVGGYRNVVDAEDYDLWLRMAELFQLANLSQALIKYRLHPGQVSVAKCRQQALGATAAKAGASARRNGKPDPLQSMREITPAVLANLGVSEAMQHTDLARGYLSSIRSMCDAGEFAPALEMYERMRCSDVRHAARWALADLRLYRARLYWRKRKLVPSTMNVIKAVMTRPIILGRPFKPMLTWFRSICLSKMARAYENYISALPRSFR